MIRIANAAGFWGDSVAAPLRTVRATKLDFLTLEYLAELTMSILARQREKDPTAGYATDFLRVLSSLTEELARQPQLHIVTNAGGMNPAACAAAAGGNGIGFQTMCGLGAAAWARGGSASTARIAKARSTAAG